MILPFIQATTTIFDTVGTMDVSLGINLIFKMFASTPLGDSIVTSVGESGVDWIGCEIVFIFEIASYRYII